MGSFSRNSQTLTLSIPLGFRFEPTDAELMDYLRKKINSLPLPCEFVIHEVDVYAYHPCFFCGDDDDASEEKYYFVKMKRHSKNENGKRPSRVQEGHAYAYDDGTIGVGGWWKATTSRKEIYSEERARNRKRTILGFKRTLKFYNFKNNKKDRNEATGTNWIMHEYNLNNNEFQEWVICGIKYKGKKGKAMSGTTNGEYLDDTSAALITTTTTTTTTTTAALTTLLAPNEVAPIMQAGDQGTEKYDDQEEEDPVRVQEQEELMANINDLLYEEDQDPSNQYPLQDSEANSNNVIIIEEDQHSSKVLVSENELNKGVVEIEQNEEALRSHEHDEYRVSNIYGLVNQSYQNQQLLQQVVQPLELNSSNTEAVRSCDEHDDWISSLYRFVNGGCENWQPLQQVQHPEADLINIEDD